MLATVVTAAVGALVALPALRLSGLYLALATAAFAVFMDRMVFNQGLVMPNDPETLADIGHYLAFMGEFARGLELSRRAMRLNPLHPGWYHFSAVRYHYDRRAYDEALADIEKIGLSHFYWIHMLRAACLGQLGQQAEARAAIDRAFALKPGLSARAELAKWNAAPEDAEHILEGLRKAGIEE